MKQKSLSIATSPIVKDDALFSGIWIRWQNLTIPERLVCANIVLLPAWWVAGLYTYMLTFIFIGVAIYEKNHYDKLRLKSPSITVKALFAFGAYTLISVVLNDRSTSITSLLRIALFWFVPALLLWYIQSNNIKVRFQAVAWACSVSVIQMLALWLVIHFGLSERSYAPPQSLFGLVTGKEEEYESGSGYGNYLMPYTPHDKVFGNLSRFSFFFLYPELGALVISYIGFIALDIKNRRWSGLLFCGCLFLLFISGTRSVWITFPVVLALRYLFTIGKVWGSSILFGLLAVTSFITLSLPAVTDLITNTYTGTVKATTSFRANSSEVRQLIYQRTLERIPDNFFLGHGVAGPTVLPGFAPARIGSHSFILGTLLYRSGLVGTGIFLVFWVSLISWFYNTRNDRPVSSYCLILLVTLCASSMDLAGALLPLILLLCILVRLPYSGKLQYA